MSDFVDLIVFRFNSMKRENPKYTLRSFADFFDETPSYMHRVMNRDITISPAKIYKYSLKLDLTREEICEYVLNHLELGFQSESSSSEKNVE